MRPNLLITLNEKSFEEMCQALLSEECPRFQAFSAPDLGMDGYDSDSETVFQCYFPEREPRKDKVLADLEKASRHSYSCKRWVLLIPKNPSAPFARWLEERRQGSLPFAIEVWGLTEINRLLRKHPGVRSQYFPTDTETLVRKITKGELPRAGDATPGKEISAEEAAELYKIVGDAAREEAERRKRKPQEWDYKQLFHQFNKKFNLSSYDRLPKSKFAEGRRYLDQTLYGRRKGDTRRQERFRCIKGVKAIQKILRIPDVRYRETLAKLTGKDSMATMDNEQLRKVFKHFQGLQGQAEAAG